MRQDDVEAFAGIAIGLMPLFAMVGGAISYIVGVFTAFHANFLVGVLTVIFVPLAVLTGFMEMVSFGHCNVSQLILQSFHSTFH